MNRRIVWTILLCATAAFSQEDHSQHDHAVAGLGTLHFPTTCAKAVAQPLTRGVALLHSFGYEDSRQAFADVAAADPKCAMAHWGVAMTWYHPVWEPPSPQDLAQGSAAIERALAIPAGSPREKDFIAALALFYRDSKSVDHRTRATAYEAAMRKMHQRYPADDEVSVFGALAMLGNLDPSDTTYAKQKEAAALLNAVLRKNPQHPGVVHYLIHSYDYPALAELALPAARAYAKIAPDASHALHMPSHIFTRLGLWDDAIQSNIAAAKSAREHVGRQHPGSGSFNELHADDYLIYAYLQEARDTSAKRVLDELAAMKEVDDQTAQAAYTFAVSPQRYALERHDWQAAAKIELGPRWFNWTPYPQFEAIAHYGRALGAALSGDLALARSELAELTGMQQRIPATKGYDWLRAATNQREIVEAVLAYVVGKSSEGRKQQALVALRQAADREDAQDKGPITPGPLLPAREILGDLLLDAGWDAEALAAYEAVLKTAPHRFNSVAGAARAATRLGDRVKASAYWSDLVRLGEHAESVRPELAEARAAIAK